MNHRSAKKVLTSKILKAALNRFSSKGYSETKISEIAGDVGLSVGALYLRFRSKEELCLELIRDQSKDFNRLTKSLPHDEPLKALKTYITINLEYAFKRRQLLSIFLREQRYPFIRSLKRDFFKTQHKIIKDILMAGVKKGVFSSMNCKDTASMIFASIRGAILLKFVFGVGNVRGMSKSLFKLITNGIRKDVP